MLLGHSYFRGVRKVSTENKAVAKRDMQHRLPTQILRQKERRAHFFSERKVEGELHICKCEQGFCLIPGPGKAV